MRKAVLILTMGCAIVVCPNLVFPGNFFDDNWPTIVFGPMGIPFSQPGSKAIEEVSRNVNRFNGEIRGAFERTFGRDVAEVLLVGQTQSELAAHLGMSYAALTEAVRTGQLDADSYVAILLSTGLRQAYARHIGNSKPVPNDVRTTLMSGGMNSAFLDMARYTVGNVEQVLG